jgi:UDP-N-acetylglucosamine 2-epimerase (non-hydrolysing)
MKELIKLSELVSYEVLFIQHPNTRVEEAIAQSGLNKSRIKIIAPLKYSDFIELMSISTLLITDSGGLQEEAYSLGIPLIVVRDKTERIQALEGNPELLVGGDGKTLVSQALHLLNGRRNTIVDFSSNKFGDGHAASKILTSIENWYRQK